MVMENKDLRTIFVLMWCHEESGITKNLIALDNFDDADKVENEVREYLSDLFSVDEFYYDADSIFKFNELVRTLAKGEGGEWEGFSFYYNEIPYVV